MNNPHYPSQFSQSSRSLFDTIVVKKLTAVSKLGLEIFMMNNNADTTNFYISPLFSINFSVSYLTLNNFLFAGDETDILESSPNIVMHFSNCSTISTCIILYFISMSVPRKCACSISQHIGLQYFSLLC